MIRREEFGICLRSHSLVYSSSIGRITLMHRLTRWIPWFVKHALVTVFNRVTCALYGHYTFGPADVEGAHFEKVCMHCCKRWEDE